MFVGVHTVASVTAYAIDGHEDAGDDAEDAEDEKRNGESDLFDGRAVVRGVSGIGVHHDVFVGDREGVVYVRHD